MSAFQFFAVGLVTGTALQVLGLWLCLLCRRKCCLWSGVRCMARGSWLCGGLLLLAVAVQDRDATLFAGQVLAGWGFWKIGLLDVS